MGKGGSFGGAPTWINVYVIWVWQEYTAQRVLADS